MDPQSTVTLHTGSPMPILGLGTWQLTKDTAGTVEAAVRLGYRMIDTSGDYGTQPGIGQAIKQNGFDRRRRSVCRAVCRRALQSFRRWRQWGRRRARLMAVSSTIRAQIPQASTVHKSCQCLDLGHDALLSLSIL
jgi:aryl-alcohol dehydrogenase-like predicted oxidoreductase